MGKLIQRVLSLALIVALIATLCIAANAATTDGFDYTVDKAAADLIITDGSAMISLKDTLRRTSIFPAYAIAAEKHTARVLFDNDQEYEPALVAPNATTFVVKAPLAIAYMTTTNLYIGVKAEFTVLAFGYEDGDELTWGLLKDTDAENSTEENTLEETGSAEIACGTVTLQDHLGTITLTAEQTADLTTDSYILQIPYVGESTDAAAEPAATEPANEDAGFISQLIINPLNRPNGSSSTTVSPTATAKPGATPSAGSTTSTGSTSAPGSTVKPGSTSKPSSSSTPTATPKPSSSVTPTATPKPSSSATPTATPKPSTTAKPSTTSTPSTGSNGSQVKVSSSDGSGNSAGVDYNNGNVSIGTGSGSINIDTTTGEVSTSDSGVQPENGQSYEIIVPSFGK